MRAVCKIIKYCAIALAISIIVSIISLCTSIIGTIADGVKDNDVNLDDLAEIKISDMESVHSLDVELGASFLLIVSSDNFKLETNNKYIRCSTDNGELKIFERAHSFSAFNTKNTTVILHIPSEFEFVDVNISGGAGDINASLLTSKKLSLELGAGKVSFDTLKVTGSAEIEGGIGDLKINGGSISNLDLDMGIGNTTIKASLLGASDLNMGVGNLEIDILGNKDDYTVRVDKGIGAITLDGQTVSDSCTVGSGTNVIGVNGGIGKIDIGFN